MLTAAEICSQPTDDAQVRAYHTRHELTESSIDAFRINCGRSTEFVGMFFGIRGIIRVQMASYVLLVTKAPLFEWSEVEPNVLEILGSFSRSQKLVDSC